MEVLYSYSGLGEIEEVVVEREAEAMGWGMLNRAMRSPRELLGSRPGRVDFSQMELLDKNE